MPASLSIEEAGRLIEDLCLMDDVFFSRCFEGSNACAELMLRVILGRDDLEVTETRTQEWIQGLPGHSAKLDITARDSRGSIYDIEIQKAGKGAGRRRARFYSAMLDAGWLGKGEDCSSLPESYVIFITPDDAIGRGLALYNAERCVRETGELYDDGTHIVHVSASLADRETDLGKLMHDLSCTDPEKMHYNVLRERTRFFKKQKEGILDMSTKFDKTFGKMLARKLAEAKAEATAEAAEKGRAAGMAEGRAEGIAEGRAEGIATGRAEGIAEGRADGILEGARNTAVNVARSMLADGSIPIDKVARFSGLPLSEVEGLRNSAVL